jgi:hypothetical protein
VDVEPVRVEGYHEVLALHRMLFASKFDDLNSVYAGSPFIAAIQNRLADALEAADPGTGWRDWRDADRHDHRLDAVRRSLSHAGQRWQEMSVEQRTAHIRVLLAPLRPSDHLVNELIQAPATSTTDTTPAGEDA